MIKRKNYKSKEDKKTLEQKDNDDVWELDVYAALRSCLYDKCDHYIF